MATGLLPTEIITVVIAVIIFFVAAHGAVKFIANWLQRDKKGVA